jgi:hypothetical protein
MNPTDLKYLPHLLRNSIKKSNLRKLTLSSNWASELLCSLPVSPTSPTPHPRDSNLPRSWYQAEDDSEEDLNFFHNSLIDTKEHGRAEKIRLVFASEGVEITRNTAVRDWKQWWCRWEVGEGITFRFIFHQSLCLVRSILIARKSSFKSPLRSSVQGPLRNVS